MEVALWVFEGGEMLFPAESPRSKGLGFYLDRVLENFFCDSFECEGEVIEGCVAIPEK